MESSWRAERPTEVLLLCPQGKLSYPKIPDFACPAATPSPVQGRSLPRHHTSPCCTHCPPWVLLGKLSLTWKHTPWWCQLGVKLEPGQCCPRGSEGQLQCLYRGRHLPGAGYTHRRGTEHGSLGCISPSWHQPWSILIVHSPQQAWRASSTEEAGAGEVGFRLEQHSRLLRSSGIFQGSRTGPCHSPMLTLRHSPSLFLDLSLGSSVHVSVTQLRSWAACQLTRSEARTDPVWSVSPTPAGQTLQHLWLITKLKNKIKLYHLSK